MKTLCFHSELHKKKRSSICHLTECDIYSIISDKWFPSFLFYFFYLLAFLGIFNSLWSFQNKHISKPLKKEINDQNVEWWKLETDGRRRKIYEEKKNIATKNVCFDRKPFFSNTIEIEKKAMNECECLLLLICGCCIAKRKFPYSKLNLEVKACILFTIVNIIIFHWLKRNTSNKLFKEKKSTLNEMMMHSVLGV